MLKSIMNQIRLSWYLLRDRRVPIWVKFMPFFVLGYIVSPIDVIPDIVLGLGQLDDVGVALAVLKTMEMVAPDYIVHEYRQRLGNYDKSQDVIDAPSYRVLHDEESQDK